MNLPCSPACERNKRPLAEALVHFLSTSDRVLEIGSGTGQHAVFFSLQMPGLVWQCSDVEDNLPDLQARVRLEGDGRLPQPLELEVMRGPWPAACYDAVFTANTLHIMPWDHTEMLLKRSSERLRPGGCLLIYGPFHDHGLHTAASNQAFDQALKARDPAMGVRDAAAIAALAAACGLQPEADLALPANNRLLVFRKPPGAPT